MGLFRRNLILPKAYFILCRIRFGRGLKLYGWPFVFRFPGAYIRIGRDVAINSSSLSNMLGLYQRTIIIAKGQGKVKIGDRTGISGATIYSWSSIKIGDDVKIGANVKIVDTDFHPVDPALRIRGCDTEALSRPVSIGNNVFIGMNSIILKGTKIGNNCVVGAGSVVSGEFGENCVIAGNPAKVIRKMQYGDGLKADMQKHGIHI